MPWILMHEHSLLGFAMWRIWLIDYLQNAVHHASVSAGIQTL